MCTCSHVCVFHLQDLLADSDILRTLPLPARALFLSSLSSWLPPPCPSSSLIYSGARDGMTPDSFHSHCDGQSPTLTLIHSKRGHVFGAYTAAAWESPPMWITKHCTSSFLFSVIGPHCEATRFPLKPGEEERSTFCSSPCGPGWGGQPKSRDLAVGTNFGAVDRTFDTASYSRLGSSYEDALGLGAATLDGNPDGHFYPVDVEVFVLTREGEGTRK